MDVAISIPEGLPPGHGVRVEGAWGAASPAPLSQEEDVRGGVERRAGNETLMGRLRRPRLRHKRHAMHREGGRFEGQRFAAGRFGPTPELVVETDEIRGFGLYTFEIKTVDERGEESGGASSATMVLAPPPLSVSGTSVAYDDETDTATFGCVHGTLLE